MMQKMKKPLTLLFSAVLSFTMAFTAVPVSAMANEGDTGTTGIWQWQEIENNTCLVTGCTAPAGELTIPAELEGKSVRGIGENAFINCTNLTGITLPDTVDFVWANAFSGCTQLANVYATSVGGIDNNAFENCSNLESITLSKNIGFIGSNAFHNCTSIHSVTIPAMQYCHIGSRAFAGCSGLHRAIIYATSAEFGDLIFENALMDDGLYSFDGSVTEDYANANNINFHNIYTVKFDTSGGTEIDDVYTIGGSITEPEEPSRTGFTFGGWYTDENMQTPWDFSHNVTTDMTLWANWTLNADRFLVSFNSQGGSRVNGIAVPNNSTFTAPAPPTKSGYSFMGWYREAACTNEWAFESDVVSGNITLYAKWDIWQWQLLPDHTLLITGCTNTAGEVTVPETINGKTVTAIGENAFQNCTGMESIDIPGSVKTIGKYAFYRCSGLEDVTLHEGLTTIGESAFIQCSSLDGISIPQSVTRITGGAFSGCASLTSITIPDGITSIEPGTFNYCTHLSSITIPGSVTSIGQYAFMSCQELYAITLPTRLEEIGRAAFMYAGLRSLDIPDSVTSIGEMAFSNCTILTSVKLGNGITRIEDGTFSFTGFVSITIPDSVTSIGEGAFSNSNVGLVKIGKNVRSIGAGAFNYCINLGFHGELRFEGPPPTLPDSLFYPYQYDGGITVYCNIQYYPLFNATLNKWPRNSYINTFCYITQDLMDGSTPQKTWYQVDHQGHMLWTIETPSRPNYEFLGWYNDQNYQSIFSVDALTHDITVYAKWRGMAYDVSFDTQGAPGTPSDKSVVYGDPYGQLPVPIRTHYTLEGWYTQAHGGGDKITATSIVSIGDNHTLYANWIPDSYDINYSLNNGTVAIPNPTNYTVESGSITLNNPTRTGYTFAGWTGTGLSVNTLSVTIPTGSSGERAYTAHWTADVYPISYSLDGGAVSTANPASYTIEDSFTLHNPARTGYTFAGWTGTGLSRNTMTVTLPAGSTGQRSYTANWTINSYTVSFNSQSGSAVAGKTAKYNTTITPPAAPSRAGYTFGGWFKEAACIHVWDFTTDKVTGNTMLYAKWQPVSAYLTGIKLSAGSIVFSKTKYTYTVKVNEYTSSVTVTPVKENDSATLKIQGVVQPSAVIPVKNGKTVTVKIAVTSGKLSKMYTLNISCAKSTNNYLYSLASSAAPLSPAFKKYTPSYTVELPEGTDRTTITAAAELPALAKVYYPSKTYILKNDQRKTVTIKVRSQAGKYNYYTVNIHRAASTNNDLSSLKTNSSLAPLSQAFNPYSNDYTVTMPATLKSITISSKAATSLAKTSTKVTINGITKSTSKVTLLNGQTATVEITVKAQSGATKVYKIVVNRL